MSSGFRRILLIVLAATISLPLWAQGSSDDVMSEAEVESLRDAAYVPTDRIAAYEKILDTRQKQIDDLLSHRRHLDREADLHDLMDQIATITDEFTDNLDEYRTKHRDVRKSLPKLLQAIDRWTNSLHAPPENDAYGIVRKLALDNLRDLRDEVTAMGPEQEAYFKEHPDAAKAEKERRDPEAAHAPHL